MKYFFLIGDACVAITYAKQAKGNKHNAHANKMIPKRDIKEGKHSDKQGHYYTTRHTKNRNKGVWSL